MTREQIESTKAWQYISKLSNEQRHRNISGQVRTDIESAWGVKVEEWPFTRLKEIPEDCLTLSATDDFKRVSYILVFKPRD